MKSILRTKGFHLMLISFLVFITLNIAENYIHYNIGRNREYEFIKLSTPSISDWLKIIIVMLMFAMLQSIFTYILD